MLAASFRRTVVLVLLIAILATRSVSAAGLQGGGAWPAQATADLLDRVLSFLRLHVMEGCKLDPDGRCYAGTTQPPHTKEGCKLDPNGRCYASTAQPPYTACKLDPNGFCVP